MSAWWWLTCGVVQMAIAAALWKHFGLDAVILWACFAWQPVLMLRRAA